MKIENNSIDSKSGVGFLKLLPNNLNDIYELSKLIKEGDRISSFTTRKVSLDGGKTQKKISLRLEIKIESLDADLVTGIIYAKGKTSCENEHVRIGSYHTLDIVLGENFVLNKSKWTSQDMNILKNCTKKEPELCFIIIYDKECVVSVMSRNDTKIIYKVESKPKNFKDIAKVIIKLKGDVSNFIIASTSEIRNELQKVIVGEDASLGKNISVFKLPSEYKNVANNKIISNILADPNFSATIKNVKFIDDMRDLQRVFAQIDTNKDCVCVGLKEISEAIEYGAVETLFATDKFCKPITINERIAVDGFIKKIKDLRARVCEIPLSSDVGERLDSYGGIICTLKFNFK